jgi:hypothetical protein
MKFTQMQSTTDITQNVFVENFLNQNRPLFIKGGASHWPAISKWTTQYLKELVGEKEVKVASSPSKVFNFNKDLGAVIEQKNYKMKDAMDLVYDTHNEDYYYYILKQSIKDACPELLGDIQLPSWADANKNYQAYLWFGQANNQDQSQFLYPTEGSRNMASQVLDIDLPDFNRYPMLAHAEFLEFTLEPGDLMFIPTGWWHQVNSLDMAISVSFWWPARIQQCLKSHILQGAADLYLANGFFDIESIVDLSDFSDNLLKVAEFLFDEKMYWLAILFCAAYMKRSDLKHFETDLDWQKQLELAMQKNNTSISAGYFKEILNKLSLEAQ